MNGDLVARRALTRRERAEMCALMMRHYDGVTRAVFEADLADKDWVIRVTDESGALRGFTTMALVETELDGEPIAALYSGDTIVDPTASRSQVVPTSWS